MQPQTANHHYQKFLFLVVGTLIFQNYGSNSVLTLVVFYTTDYTTVYLLIILHTNTMHDNQAGFVSLNFVLNKYFIHECVVILAKSSEQKALW